MKTMTALAAGLLAFGTLASSQVPAHGTDLRALVEQTKAVALGMQQHMVSRMRAELKKGDLEGAFAVCTTVAEATASRVSREHGWRVVRVSLRPRNPLVGFADTWEQRVLLDFEARQARGEDPAAMEHFEIVDEPSGRFLRYLKALPVGPVCMGCHGPEENLKPEISAALKREYPGDAAAGYRPGQIRGGLAVKRPL